MNEQKFCVRTPVWQFLLFLFFLLLVLFMPYAITQILKESVLTATARIIFIVAGSIWCLFVILFFLLQLHKSLTYIKVDGQTFLVRTGFRRKYKVTCDDLKSIYCQKIVHSGSKGTTTEHRINITFKNGKLVKINWEDKNFKKMAQYFYDMHEAGVIAPKVIHKRHKETLLRYSKGKFREKTKFKMGGCSEGIYSTTLTVAEYNDTPALIFLLYLPLWLIAVMATLCLLARKTLAADIAGPIFLATFLSIIPYIIVLLLYKKLTEKKKEKPPYCKEFVFEVRNKKVYLDNKKVKIVRRQNASINTFLTKGYIVQPQSMANFDMFLNTNDIPYTKYK